MSAKLSAVGLVIFGLILAVGYLTRGPSGDDAVDFPREAPNIGSDTSFSFPSEQPLLARLFLVEGEGTPDFPYLFCRIASGRTGQTCLFSVAFTGPAKSLEPLAWYQVAATFPAELRPGVPLGQLLGAAPSTPLSPAGSGLTRSSRFQESSEALSNWAVGHGMRGYLRAEGVYVWYLSDDAAQAAALAGIRRLEAVWRDAG